jgi:HEAT repeat protein
MQSGESEEPASSLEPPPISATPEPTSEAAPSNGKSRVAIKILVGVIVFLIALISIVTVGRQLAGRRTAGLEKTVAEWIEQLTGGPTPEARRQAAEAIAELGPESVASTLDAIADVPQGGGMYSVDKAAVAALAGVGPALVEPLSASLQSDSQDVRLAAACVLGELGRDAKGAVALLTGALDDESLWVRRCAAQALGRIGPDATEATEALALLTTHEDRQTRLHAVQALGQIGPAAEGATAALARVRDEDPEFDVRRAAEAALHQVDLDGMAARSLNGASEEVRQLIAKLSAEDEFERVDAAERLAEIGPQAVAAIPALAKALEHEDKWLREAAAETLGTFGSSAAPVAAALRRISQKDHEPEPEVRAAAKEALERIEINR